MPMSLLEELFEALKTPDGTADEQIQTFTAIPLPEQDLYKIAKDDLGYPCLLIKVGTQSDAPPPIRLMNLQVQHSVQCLVWDPGNVPPEQCQFTVVRCNSEDIIVRHHFFDLAETLIRSLGPSPTGQLVATRVFNFANLFRLMAEPPRKTVQGLWSEMFLIAQSSEPAALILAWHNEPDDHLDFNAGPTRIEVKSSSQRSRRHIFSLEQLSPPPGVSQVIASLFVEPSRGGVSLSELSVRVKERISNFSLSDIIDRIFYASLGTDLELASKASFDYELAESSLQFYAVEQVPSITGEIPSEVSEVKFRSDLSRCKALKAAAIKRLGGLIAAALPEASQD